MSDLMNPPVIRPASFCLRSDPPAQGGYDISDCTVEHACRYPGSAIGRGTAHDARRRDSHLTLKRRPA
jgi:hypothetical protein